MLIQVKYLFVNFSGSESTCSQSMTTSPGESFVGAVKGGRLRALGGRTGTTGMLVMFCPPLDAAEGAW